MDLSPVQATRTDPFVKVPRPPLVTSSLPPVGSGEVPRTSSGWPALVARVGTRTDVEFTHHPSGVTQLRFVDKHTGEALEATPADTVLDAVSSLIEFVARKASE